MATVGLTTLKVGVGVISGSVGVLSEGIHSFLDLISAAISFFTVRHAIKPADQDHPFGHGKIETISSLFEALLLVVAAVMIVWEAVDHVIHPQPVAYQGLAMAVILFSMVVSWWTYRHNLKAAKETGSTAIHVNALHFLSDVVASAGVLAGLVLLKFTGWLLIDPIMGFAVAAYIFAISVKQVKHALMELSDVQLPAGEIQLIQGMIDGFKDRMIEAHDLRTRKSGVYRHVDFHLVVCGHATVQQSHDLCDAIEEKILSVFPGTSVSIHVEPCEEHASDCEARCSK